MSSHLEGTAFNSLKASLAQGQRDRIARARQAVAGSKTVKPARKPALLLILGAIGGSFALSAMVNFDGDHVLLELITMALSAAFFIGLVFLVASFVQLGVPVDFRDEFALTIKRYGRDPIKQALSFALGAALIWGLGIALILGLNALANGAGIPFMIIWSFVGMAMGMASFVNLLRAFFTYGAYKRDIWEKFLDEVGSKV